MQLRSKSIVTLISGLVAFLSAGAQTNTHFVSATFTEKVYAEVWVSKIADKKSLKIAEYTIAPDDRDFVFAIPKDSGASYRFQVVLQKPGGRHMKTDRIAVLPLSFNPSKDYSLKITPSKLDTAKKRGWELKQTAANPSIALISGKVLNTSFRNMISLQRVTNGELKTEYSFDTNNEGDFVAGYAVKQPGFYYLTTLRWRIRVYLKPGDQLELNINPKTGYPVLVKGSQENQLLYKWQQLILPITSYGYYLSIINVDSLDLETYIRDYENLEPAMNQFISANSVSNTRFSREFKIAMETDRDLTPLNFLLQHSVKGVKGYRPRPKDFKEVPVFYQRFIQPGKYKSASLLMLGEARQLMDLYAKLNIAVLPKEQKVTLSQSEKLGLMMNAIPNDTLKSLFFQDQMGQMEVNNLSEFRATFEPFKKYTKLASVRSSYDGIYSLFSGDTAYIGKSSYNFSLPDTSGRMVSMKDFKGKVVFIDVWATWCGPCKEQIPFLKEIEEEYKDNKDLVFMGISIDRVNDREKWLKMIRKENLHGVQLLDDMGKVFARPYEINAIPRFLLIDKKGNWIEVRCPRPESKEKLKKYLDKALMEKI